MFWKLAPQKVKSLTGGYIVQIASRHSIEYVESDRTASVEMEIGSVFGIFRDTLTQWNSAAGPTKMSVEEREMVLKRIVAGLRHMGTDSEIC
jgi:hypothetical protein